MQNRKLKRAFGLSIVATLGLLAFNAVSAQAGVFKIAGGSALSATIEGTMEALGTLLVPGRNLTLTCHNGNLLPVSQIINANEALGIVQFTNCLPLSHTKGTALPCTIHHPEITVRALPALHPANTPYIIAEADNAQGVLGHVTTLGESCPLPPLNPIKGEVAGQLTTNNAPTALISFKPGMLSTLLTNPLSFGGSAATVDGSGTLLLTGAHKDLNFGVA